MKSKPWVAQRYQMNKDILTICKSGHPWIFRSHVSSAIEVFEAGQLLRLVDANNQTWGYGLYDPDGLIAIRILKEGKNPPENNWFSKRLDQILEKRAHLRNYTDAFRAVHGENDGFPGVVIDIYGKTGVLQTYSASVDSLGRYLASLIVEKLQLENLIWKIPTKRASKTKVQDLRVLRGHLPAKVCFREGKMNLTVEIGSGQKSGAFLDLRALRKWISSQKLHGKRVLNLFSYTGTLGLAAEVAGAKEIWNVDISKGALETAQKVHVLNIKKHRPVVADVFEWLKSLPEKEKFDLIIVDPPQMTSQVAQVPVALRAYRQLYSLSLKHLNDRGILVAACCTSRISRPKFKETVCPIVSPPLKLIKTLQPEDDHPVGFQEGDYLKILIFEN
ncbi:MAG: class I SAM-dependent rRNA methyltransferase [Proteobacteria bacterium]|nr:class I SAM-dependent rRNA methyltransferase [Pseudomonadota bacterium]NDC23240.1 class I SAM-dependent rRNA methyltransferase [Pseudomonadota bacterium]NDD03496.1 class I SAM-dependent rRNA methyltransferase [Pseudomonadota bacterium]NDG26314.1 class I SAM-dependent rRNA methyltransferase [Pseudomonadota bacterium]